MPGTGPVTHHRQSAARGPVDQTWTSDDISIVAKQICEACNTGWMAQLEGAAKPYITPLIQGRGRHLHETGQTLVAAWAAKTALALHLTTPEKGAPVEHYREMTATHRAPAQSQIWLGRFDAISFHAYHESHLLDLRTNLLQAKGYTTTLAVGHLVVQVTGYCGIEDEVTITKGGAWQQATLQIHPFQGRMIIWPPPVVLTEDALKTFAAPYPQSGT